MNAIRIAAVLAGFAALGACSQGASDPAGRTGAGKAASGAKKADGKPSPSPAAAGCAAAIPVELDRSETAMVDWRMASAAQLDAFRSRADRAFRSAAESACHSEPKVAAALKPVRKLLLQSGSGATEPVFYQEDGADGTLIFQYAFTEAKLEMPDGKAIAQGLRCWADPDWKACEDMGD